MNNTIANNKRHVWWIALALLTACENVETYEKIETQEEITVSLNITVEEEEKVGDNATRAIHINPGAENLIYDIWVLQFDVRGPILRPPYHYRRDVAGSLQITNMGVDLNISEESIVCFVANLDPTHTEPNPFVEVDSYAEFCEQKRKLVFNADGSMDRIPMFGYYQGEISVTYNTLGICLGRLVARVTLVITNNTGSTLSNMWMRVNNAPLFIPYYADRLPIPKVPVGEDRSLYFDTYTDKVGNDGTFNINGEKSGTLTNGSSSTHYFYVGENVYPFEENITHVDIGTGTYPTTFTKSVNVKLGTDPPFPNENINNRNYNLGRNNGFLCTINLR